MDEHVFFNPGDPVWNSSGGQELVPGRLFNQIFPDSHLIDEGGSQKLAEDFDLGWGGENTSQ